MGNPLAGVLAREQPHGPYQAVNGLGTVLAYGGWSAQWQWQGWLWRECESRGSVNESHELSIGD